MKGATITRQLLGYEISACFLPAGSGVNVLLTGGSRPHIGAVTIATGGDLSTTVWEGHKDDVISQRWAKSIAQKGAKPVVVSVGIHYPNVTKEEIRLIMESTDQMLADWMSGCL